MCLVFFLRPSVCKLFRYTSPEPLVQIQNNFTDILLVMPSTTMSRLHKIATRAKIEISFNDISLATMYRPKHTLICQDLGERSGTALLLKFTERTRVNVLNVLNAVLNRKFHISQISHCEKLVPILHSA